MEYFRSTEVQSCLHYTSRKHLKIVSDIRVNEVENCVMENRGSIFRKGRNSPLPPPLQTRTMVPPLPYRTGFMRSSIKSDHLHLADRHLR